MHDPILRDNDTPAAGGSIVEDGLGKVIIVLANVLPHFGSFTPSQVETTRPWRSICARVVDRNFVFQCSRIGTRKAFDQMETFGMRQAVAAHPELFVESYRIDDQCIPFPMSQGIAVVSGEQTLRMIFAIEIDDAVRMRASDIEDVDALLLRHLDKLESVWRDEFA